MSQRPAWEIAWGPHNSGKGSSWVSTLHRTPSRAGETFLLLGERRQPCPSPSRHTGPRLGLSLGASVLRRPSERASGLPWVTQQGRGRGRWGGGLPLSTEHKGLIEVGHHMAGSPNPASHTLPVVQPGARCPHAVPGSKAAVVRGVGGHLPWQYPQPTLAHLNCPQDL